MLHTEASRAIDYRQLKISSTVFKNGKIFPSKYTCDPEFENVIREHLIGFKELVKLYKRKI